jgi:hypothetical protein
LQVPILSGIYVDNGPDFRISYPVNMVPVPLPNGASNGYLRPAEGTYALGNGSGATRAQINWNGTLYAIHGTDFVSIDVDGNVLVLGTVAAGGTATMDYGFDYLYIAAGDRLYLYDGSTLTEVTDPDLGAVLDVLWIDGYWMTTDGEYLVVGDLTNPFAINPLKYGAAEASPDPIVGLLRLRNEVYAVGRNTIEVFDNVGGTGFPFARIEGAQIPKGAVGTHAACVFMEAVAFLGGGVNEAPGVYVGSGGATQKVSTVEIDRILEDFTEAELADTVLEARNDRAHQHLYVHLPDRTLVYDATASQALGQAVWFVLTSGLSGFSQYRIQHMTWCYDRWNVGDPTDEAFFGYLDATTGQHWGDEVRWEFATTMLYAEGRGAVLDRLELVALPGSSVHGYGTEPTISTSYSLDGVTWSRDFSISVGGTGDRRKRLCWFRQGAFRNRRMQRFQGDSTSHVSFARLEAAVTPLAF